jgi:hypothetical protein
MAVIVKTNKQKWRGVVEQASDKALYALAEQMLADSEKFVPYSGGSGQSADGLRESGKVVKGEDKGIFYLVWDQVYALYQWFGIRADGTHKVHHYTTPGTTKQWVEAARNKCGKRWHDILQKRFTEDLR